MSSIDEQIALSRAKKKKTLVSLAVGVVVVAVIIVGVIALLSYVPSAQPVVEDTEVVAVEEAPEIDRKALQAELVATEKRVKALVATPFLSTWKTTEVEALQADMQVAFDLYAASDYSQTSVSLKQLNAAIVEYKEQFTQAFEQPYQEANKAFAEGNIEYATETNAQALQVNGHYSEAIALQQRIDAYYQVADLYEEARVGEVEGDLSKQRDAYERILQLDAKQQKAIDALADVKRLMQEEQFAQALAEAVKAIDTKDYQTAQQALNKAANIDQNRPELATLQLQIDSALKAQNVSAIEEQIQVFASADEWPTVFMLAQKGSAEFPDRQIIQQALQSAEQIISANKVLDSYLDAPERLSDNNIRGNAISAVSNYRSLTVLSNKLSAKIGQLEDAIEIENQPLAVTVRSDNKTYIRVLGVGVVGEVSEKTIRLKPGKYRLEGRREGYRSTIVEVEVEKAGVPIVVTIQCNERV